MYKLDVDYCVQNHTDIEVLNRNFDDLRIRGMANLEELLQLIEVNQEFARKQGWKVEAIQEKLSQVLTVLAKEI